MFNNRVVNKPSHPLNFKRVLFNDMKTFVNPNNTTKKGDQKSLIKSINTAAGPVSTEPSILPNVPETIIEIKQEEEKTNGEIATPPPSVFQEKAPTFPGFSPLTTGIINAIPHTAPPTRRTAWDSITSTPFYPRNDGGLLMSVLKKQIEQKEKSKTANNSPEAASTPILPRENKATNTTSNTSVATSDTNILKTPRKRKEIVEYALKNINNQTPKFQYNIQSNNPSLHPSPQFTRPDIVVSNDSKIPNESSFNSIDEKNSYELQELGDPSMWSEQIVDYLLQFAEICMSSARRCKSSSIKNGRISQVFQALIIVFGSLITALSISNLADDIKIHSGTVGGAVVALLTSFQTLGRFSAKAEIEMLAYLDMERMSRSIRIELAKLPEKRVDPFKFIIVLENQREKILRRVGLDEKDEEDDGVR